MKNLNHPPKRFACGIKNTKTDKGSIITGSKADIKALQVLSERMVNKFEPDGSYWRAGLIVSKRLLSRFKVFEKKSIVQSTESAVHLGACLRPDGQCTFFPRFEDCECEMKKSHG